MQSEVMSLLYMSEE